MSEYNKKLVKSWNTMYQLMTGSRTSYNLMKGFSIMYNLMKKPCFWISQLEMSTFFVLKYVLQNIVWNITLIYFLVQKLPSYHHA